MEQRACRRSNAFTETHEILETLYECDSVLVCESSSGRDDLGRNMRMVKEGVGSHRVLRLWRHFQNFLEYWPENIK